jgi:tRNA A37 threonylcarbamoyltransferase TsaD
VKKRDTQFLTPKTIDKCTNEPNDAHKKSLKLEIMEEVAEKFLEKVLDMVSKKVQDALKKFQDTTNKELEKT